MSKLEVSKHVILCFLAKMKESTLWICYFGCRMATDLEPLQPLLKKFITFLETEALPSTSLMPRPRVQLDRLSVWLGIKSL